MDFGTIGSGLSNLGAGINNLMQNRLFQQYLLSGGGALASGQSAIPAIGAATQQSMAAQSQASAQDRYMKMIAGMISGEKVPEGGKITRDDKGTKIEIPSAAFEPIGGGGEMSMQPTGGSAFNPFRSSQPNFSTSDLVGLGPQDVSRALTNAINFGSLKQRSIEARRSAAEKDPLSKDFVIPHPEAGTMTLRQWQTLPAFEKEFSCYAYAAKKLGAPKDELTRKFFSSLEPTEREQFTRAAMSDPKLMTAAKELAGAGATRVSIGEKVAGKVAEKKALSKIAGQLYFSEGKDSESLSKYMKDKRSQIFMASEGGDNPTGAIIEKAKLTIGWYRKELVTRGAKIISEEWSEDGNSKIWTVKWKDGTTEEVIRDVSS